MKNLKFSIPIFILIIGISLAGCGETETQQNTSEMEKNGETTESHEETKKETGYDEKSGSQSDVIKINLPSMQCNMCKKKISTAISGVDGVENVEVSVSDKMAIVSYDKNKTNLSLIENSITSAGYVANDKKADPIAYEKLDDCCKVPDKKSY